MEFCAFLINRFLMVRISLFVPLFSELDHRHCAALLAVGGDFGSGRFSFGNPFVSRLYECGAGECEGLSGHTRLGTSTAVIRITTRVAVALFT